MTHDPPTARGETELNAAVQPTTTTTVPRLTIISGPGSGRAFAMASQLATAGRHATNDLVIDDPRVSGVHLQLRRVGDRVHVRDAGSTNGTWLGRHRITEIELAAGAEIQLGGSAIRIEVDDDATASPLS